MKITISGESGSGKTTVGEMLAKNLNYNFYSGGYFFRKKAEEYKMDIIEFSTYAERHREIDLEEDKLITDFIKNHDNIVIESRLCGYLSHKESIDSYRIFLYAEEDTRINRLLGRDDGASKENIIKRERSELRRYMTFYGIDYRNYQYYNLIIKTDNLSIENVLSSIMFSIKKKS